MYHAARRCRYGNPLLVRLHRGFGSTHVQLSSDTEVVTCSELPDCSSPERRFHVNMSSDELEYLHSLHQSYKSGLAELGLENNSAPPLCGCLLRGDSDVSGVGSTGGYTPDSAFNVLIFTIPGGSNFYAIPQG